MATLLSSSDSETESETPPGSRRARAPTGYCSNSRGVISRRSHWLCIQWRTNPADSRLENRAPRQVRQGPAGGAGLDLSIDPAPPGVTEAVVAPPSTTLITIPPGTDGAEWAVGHAGGPYRPVGGTGPGAAPAGPGPGPETRKSRADHPQG
ncbi:hypothetical protein GCM10010519_11220 [Streptomyces lactacystinicus]